MIAQGIMAAAIGVEVDQNTTSEILGAAGTYTGEAVNVSSYASVVIALKTDQSGTLYAEFSPDGENWDSSLSSTVTAGVNEVHRYTITRKWFRVRYVNGGTPQTYFRLQTLVGFQPALTSTLSSTVQSDADAAVTRSVLMGQTDSGSWANVPVDEHGHLEVALHSPRLPFGSIHTENLNPIFQTDAVYGVNEGQVEATQSGSGSASASDSSFTCSTGTTIYSYAAIQSRKRLRYRPGQGVVGRFTAKYTTGVADSYQVAGFGHSEDGVYFGYKGADFGIIYNKRGAREVRTLTISTASSTTENVTVTLNGTAYTIAVTNSANIQRTVWELSQGTFAGWKCYATGATVVFVRDSVGAASGVYSISGTTVVGSFAQTRAGAAVTEQFIAQADWNGDPMDGTGSSGVTIDPTKGNVYQIGIQYLGYGAIVFQVEVSAAGNNAVFVTCHTLALPNTLTATSFRNPSFPFTMSAYSAGSTTNLTVSSASFAGFIEGEKKLHGNRFSYFAQSTAVDAATYRALFTVMNKRYYGGIANQAVVNLLSVSGAIKHSSPVILYLVKNGTLAGNPSFADYSTTSCTTWDTSATTVTWSNNNQVIWSGHLGDTGELDHHFNGGSEETTLQPGEWLTLCAKSTFGTPSYVTGSINTREDQ
jgi:hypothetical protein